MRASKLRSQKCLNGHVSSDDGFITLAPQASAQGGLDISRSTYPRRRAKETAEAFRDASFAESRRTLKTPIAPC